MAVVGVLALQGGFGLHARVCEELGYSVREVRDAADLDGLGALILPGGESTTIGLLAGRRGLAGPLGAVVRGGLPTLGTCAGAILLAKTIVASDQFRWGTLDVTIERNAYGSQVDSFEAALSVTGIPGVGSVPGVFIRAPRILATGPGVEVLASDGGWPVLVRQGTQVAVTFHPELTSSRDLHRWFLTVVAGLPPKVPAVSGASRRPT